MLKKNTKFIFIASLILLFGFLYNNGFQEYLTLDYAKNSLNMFKEYDLNHPVQTKALFFVIYLGVVALSLPGATIMTLLAGALFGAITGTILVSFASTMGASLAFLSSRYILRNWFQTRFADKYAAVNEGLIRDGIFYLFSLRLIPLFLVNIVMGLTQIPLRTFFWVSRPGQNH